MTNNLEISNLVEQNIGLVGNVYKRFQDYQVEKEELISVGYYALVKAARTFKDEKGYKFSTYATVVITNEMIKFVKKELKNNEINSINKIIYYNENNNPITLEESLISSVNIEMNYIQKENYIELYEAIKKLDKIEQEWIYLYYGFYDRRYKEMEIARMYNIEQYTFSRKLKRIRNKLKEILLSKQDKVKQISK